MAFVNDIQRFETGLVRRMRDELVAARNAFAKRRLYNKTLAELSAMTDRELDDLGVSRHALRDVAFKAAYGN